jgi:hypothetical protein
MGSEVKWQIIPQASKPKSPALGYRPVQGFGHGVAI